MELAVIQSKIYEIRGIKVMLDFDLAEMYGVDVKRLNEAVKRNIKRFPADFMYQLSTEEWYNLKSQIATSSWGGRRKLPYAFTEQGLAMLSGVLNSETAINVNISIMRAFVEIRQMLMSDYIVNSNPVVNLQQEVKQLKDYIEDVFKDYNDINEQTRQELDNIYLAIGALSVKKTPRQRNKIGSVKPE